MMKISEEDKKRLEEEFIGLNRTPIKPCRWIKNHLEYGTLWTMGFFIGLMEGLKNK